MGHRHDQRADVDWGTPFDRAAYQLQCLIEDLTVFPPLHAHAQRRVRGAISKARAAISQGRAARDVAEFQRLVEQARAADDTFHARHRDLWQWLSDQDAQNALTQLAAAGCSAVRLARYLEAQLEMRVPSTASRKAFRKIADEIEQCQKFVLGHRNDVTENEWDTYLASFVSDAQTAITMLRHIDSDTPQRKALRQFAIDGIIGHIMHATGQQHYALAACLLNATRPQGVERSVTEGTLQRLWRRRTHGIVAEILKADPDKATKGTKTSRH